MQRRKGRARRHEGREGGVEWVEIGGYKKKIQTEEWTLC